MPISCVRVRDDRPAPRRDRPREQQRHRTESDGEQHRRAPRGQRALDPLVHRADVVERKLRIETCDRRPSRPRELQRLAGRAYHQAEVRPGRLGVWEVVGPNALVGVHEGAELHAAHDAHDVEPLGVGRIGMRQRLGALRPPHRLADRAAVRPESAGQSLVDDDDARRVRASRSSKKRPSIRGCAWLRNSRRDGGLVRRDQRLSRCIA